MSTHVAARCLRLFSATVPVHWPVPAFGGKLLVIGSGKGLMGPSLVRLYEYGTAVERFVSLTLKRATLKPRKQIYSRRSQASLHLRQYSLL